LLYAAEPVKENSTGKLTLTFYNEDDTEVIPTAGTIKIVDVASGTVIRDTTAFTPTTATYSITITATENRILDQMRSSEQRRITVTFSYGASKAGTGDFIYPIKNLPDIN